jgi:hypothetical protein
MCVNEVAEEGGYECECPDGFLMLASMTSMSCANVTEPADAAGLPVVYREADDSYFACDIAGMPPQLRPPVRQNVV